MAEPLRNIAEAAEFLGIPKTTLQEKVTARLVPHTRIGRHVRFTQAHLDQIVAAGEQPVIQPPTRLDIAAARLRAVSLSETPPPSTPPPSPPPSTPPPPAGPSTPPPPSGPKSSEAVA